MLNYWTEGGFIAFGQEPDSNTGRTPLQLFMDGRAQAAYNRDAFEEWSTIMAGGMITGQIAARAEARRQSVSSDDYVKIGQWMDEQLRSYNVWVVLMPQTEYRTPPPQVYYRKMSYHAIQGIERNPNWPLVFFNNKQKLFVDVRTPRGKELFDGIFNGKTLYPDDFHRNLILARNTLLFFVNQLEQQRGQIDITRRTVKNRLDNENLIVKAKEKAVAQFRDKLGKLSERLKTVQESLEDTQKQGGLELEELENQKDQIEKEKKSVQAKLDNENAIIRAKEKVVAESREKLAQLSEQLKTVQKRLRDAKQQGLNFAIEAFNLSPSPAPMREIILVASGFAELRPHVKKFCEDYVNKFTENEADWANQDGYRDRVEAARLACFYLENVARTQRNTKLVNIYAAQEEKCLRELLRLAQSKRW
jgi:hypothetical protein